MIFTAIELTAGDTIKIRSLHKIRSAYRSGLSDRIFYSFISVCGLPFILVSFGVE